MFDFLKNDADRQLMELMVATKAIALPFAAPPGVPPARLETLRRAFDATQKDPDFQAEAKKMLFDSDPTTGEETQKIIAKFYQTPPEVVERAKKLLTPQ